MSKALARSVVGCFSSCNKTDKQKSVQKLAKEAVVECRKASLIHLHNQSERNIFVSTSLAQIDTNLLSVMPKSGENCGRVTS